LWAFVRLVWGEDLLGDARFRTHSWDDPPPTHFVRVAGELLISHALVLPLSFPTVARRCASEGSAPSSRSRSSGARGTPAPSCAGPPEHIDRTADVGMLFCDVRTVPFYERLGWIALPRGRVLIDGHDREDVAMVLGDAGTVPDPFRLPWSW
jgi:hypothetical protein